LPAEASSTAPAVASNTTAAPFLRSEWGYRWDASKPGIASSAEDAAWLEANGFPGPDVEDHLRRLSVGELRTLAGRGNQPASAVLAYRLATLGTPREEVLALLHGSAANGSVYALKTAGDIFMMVDGYRDPAMASAYYGLQARSGDQSGFEQRYLVDQQLSGDRRLQAGLIEEALWREIGLSSSEVDERPGFSAFIQGGRAPL